MKKWIFLTGLALFLFSGCQKENDLMADVESKALQSQQVVRSVIVGEEVTLKMNEMVMIQPEGILLTFRDVTEDSRCPEGVTCIWQGRAVVQLLLAGRGESVETRLATKNTQPKPPSAVTVMGLDIYMRDVMPYPTIDYPVIPNKYYRVCLLINRGGSIDSE